MSKATIKNIKAREILDSRGNPTVEVELKDSSGSIFKSSVASGASKGKYEAEEIRDGGKRFLGLGVLKAVKNINEIIAPKIIGQETVRQKEIDKTMIDLDATDNKSNLGANAICPLSMAVCRAGAEAEKLQLFEYIKKLSFNKKDYKLPLACFNIINGGLHAGSRLDVQEFMIVPQKKAFSQNLQMAVEIYQRLKEILAKKYGKTSTNLGDEGGFAPPLVLAEQALEYIMMAAGSLKYSPDIKIILDVAASQFFKKDKYKMNIGVFTAQGLERYYFNLISKYPIMGLEDPFAEDDWQSFVDMKKKSKQNKLLIIGDDLLVTNPGRIRQAQEKEAVNAMILKINQIGTVSEALEAGSLAKDFGWKIIVSHRSGETNDDFIADLAVGIGADFIKTGAPARGERVSKYNRLLKIEQELNIK